MAEPSGRSDGRIEGMELTDSRYTVETSTVPFQQHDVTDAEGELVLQVGSLYEDGTVTFSDVNDTPVFRLRPENDDRRSGWNQEGETSLVSVTQYTIVEASTDEAVATLERTKKVGVREYDIEAADGTHLGTITTGGRLRGILRGVPLTQFVVSLRYSVQTPDGRTLGTVAPSGMRMTGRSYTVEMDRDGPIPTLPVVAATVPLKFDEGPSGGSRSTGDVSAAGE